MKIYYVDSFTEEAFKGNPAAVVIQDKFLSDDIMQSIAQEIGFSETAFLLKEEDSNYSLRWFTPTTEVSLCGHATLATAKIFFTFLELELSSVKFKTKYGIVKCFLEEDRIRMDLPRDKLYKLDKFFDIKNFFAFPIKESIFFSEVNHYLCIFVADDLYLSKLIIDIDSVRGLSRLIPEIRGLIISNLQDGKVKMRFFDPWEGIPEDPVTGSAALVVSEYWLDYFNVNYLEIEQMCSRGGKMFVKKSDKCISIIGTATIVLEGKLMVGKYGK